MREAVDVFSADNSELLLDDCLPGIQIAAGWNACKEQEQLLQLLIILIDQISESKFLDLASRFWQI